MIYLLQDKVGYYYAGLSQHFLPPAYQHVQYTRDWRLAKKYWTKSGCKHVLDNEVHINHRQNFIINNTLHILLEEMKKYFVNKWSKFSGKWNKNEPH